MSKPRKGLSQRQAAELLGVSQPRVAALAQEGKIRTLPDGSLCPGSIRERSAVARLARVRRGDNGGEEGDNPPAVSLPPLIGEVDPDIDPDEVGVENLPGDWSKITAAEAIRRKEAALAYRNTLAAQEAAGILVNADEVEQAWVKIVSGVRERLLGVPTRAATRLGLTDEQQRALEDLQHQALADLSEQDDL